MSLPSLLAVAVALAMDAVAAAVGIGLCTRERVLACASRVGLHFGLFQAGMTLAGYLAGTTVSGRVVDASQWVAAALLWLVGAHMLVEGSLRRTPRGHTRTAEDAPPEAPRDPSRGVSLICLSVATSIDAFGVGTGLAFLGASRVWLAAAVIGVIAAVLPAAGLALALHVAARTGERLARAAELAGACVLIGIGARIAFFGQ